MSDATKGPIEQIKVFISSVMNVQVEDLLAERRIVQEVVESFDFLRAWAFESTPASSEDLDESYLRPVTESDLFILIVGAQITDPVIAESLRAKELDKHILCSLRMWNSGRRDYSCSFSNLKGSTDNLNHLTIWSARLRRQ